jgi:hypothetical protein
LYREYCTGTGRLILCPDIRQEHGPSAPANFLLVRVVSAFETSDEVSFECIPFLDQLVNALPIGSFEAVQPL